MGQISNWQFMEICMDTWYIRSSCRYVYSAFLIKWHVSKRMHDTGVHIGVCCWSSKSFLAVDLRYMYLVLCNKFNYLYCYTGILFPSSTINFLSIAKLWSEILYSILMFIQSVLHIRSHLIGIIFTSDAKIILVRTNEVSIWERINWSLWMLKPFATMFFKDYFIILQ